MATSSVRTKGSRGDRDREVEAGGSLKMGAMQRDQGAPPEGTSSSDAKAKGENVWRDNPDRRIVLVAPVTDNQEEEEEYDFGQDEEVSRAQHIWYAIAHFYTGQNFNAWTVFSELSNAWGRKEVIPFRSLGENRFIVEFDSEKLWKRVLDGGPWRFRGGDAMIFVPYDGLQRASEIEIESINLWIRIYDIPAIMMTYGFARVLGEKWVGYSRLERRIVITRELKWNFHWIELSYPRFSKR
jgi:hypothetical protein